MNFLDMGVLFVSPCISFCEKQQTCISLMLPLLATLIQSSFRIDHEAVPW